MPTFTPASITTKREKRYRIRREIQMHRKRLGKSDLLVSAIGLGAQFWGGDQDKDEAFRQLDFAVDHGVNLIDTAEIYPVPYSESTWGNSERIIGLWLERKKA